jgi:myo-inositol-1(or 4)-monophosphatase
MARVKSFRIFRPLLRRTSPFRLLLLQHAIGTGAGVDAQTRRTGQSLKRGVAKTADIAAEGFDILAISLPAVNGGQLLELFGAAAGAVAASLVSLSGDERRVGTDRTGQYRLDLVADAAALEVLHRMPVAVLSEESAWSGRRGADITVVVDPVDGSTNCSRGLPYWATSLCAVDGDGPLAALVVNQVTGSTTTAVRGEGAWRDGAAVVPSKVERVEEAVVALSGPPARWLPWRQFRALGSIALVLCDLAAGGFDGVVDGSSHHAPWDYLGGLLACSEAGVTVVDAVGRSLADVDGDVRRQLLGAATPALLDELRRAAA